MNLLSDRFAVINGKTLTTPEKNLLGKLAILGLETDDTNSTVRVNRVTDVQSHPLHPVVAALVDFIYVAYRNYERNNYKMTFNGKSIAIATFDRVKYLVLKLDNKAYYDLVD